MFLVSVKTLTAISLCFASVLAGLAPYRREVELYQGETTGRHIVTLKDGASCTDAIKLAKDAGSQIHAELNIINGSSGHFDEGTLAKLRSHPDVVLVAEDGIMHAKGQIVQTDAPWGISRLTTTPVLYEPDNVLNFTFVYDSSAGGCADIYIVDTGIYTDHVDFGGRARWGGTFGGYPSSDGSGHGTHCAGTAIGTQFGVAKKATAYAIKVLGDTGAGSTADIVSGLDWILTNVQATGRPSVVSLSLGGSASTALDNAVITLIAAGIHVVVAAGPTNSSPSRISATVSVDSTTSSDIRSSSGLTDPNTVDIFAPGRNIVSTWIGSPTATYAISGPSTSTAHVAGLVAYLICLEGNIPPGAMQRKLMNYATHISDVALSSHYFLLAHMP